MLAYLSPTAAIDWTNLTMIALAVPSAMVLATWLLQLSCMIGTIDPPTFSHALVCTVVVVLANVLLQVGLHEAGVSPGLGTRLLAPFVLSAVVLAITLRANPLDALVVTVGYGLLCAGLVVAADTVGTTIGQIH